MPSYIVESYAADGAVADQQARAQLTAELGSGIRYVRTTILPGDETVLHLFEAASADVLREAVAASHLDCDRVVEVLETADRGVTGASSLDGLVSAPAEPGRRRSRS